MNNLTGNDNYHSAPTVTTPAQKSSPYELGLGRSVKLKRSDGSRFIGQSALQQEVQRGPLWQFVTLEIDWEALEALYARAGLPPHISPIPSRDSVPIFSHGMQVGQATSRAWSPLLKKYLALASVQTAFARQGTTLEIEHTVENERRRVRASVVQSPAFEPARKRA